MNISLFEIVKSANVPTTVVISIYRIAVMNKDQFFIFPCLLDFFCIHLRLFAYLYLNRPRKVRSFFSVPLPL